METITINPGVFFTCAAVTALLAFASTVGRRYHAELRRELAEAPATAAVVTAGAAHQVIPSSAARLVRPTLTVIRGGREDRPGVRADHPRAGTGTLQRAA